FFPLTHALQGNRFIDMLRKHALEVYLMNTGRVGGPDGDSRSFKVRIPHSSAIVKGIAEGTIDWEKDPDFGSFIARSVPGIDRADWQVLDPRRLYLEQGRSAEYQTMVERLRAERRAYLQGFPGLEPEIVAALE
ncbi:MAG: phosphoenolpyruvate carboxykinase (ATP), partial [Planctomycetes bacterium]|nr:phosphoenolpyruvate carboxykinase (ATP) [Planctomycetota bacterium]